MRTDNTPVEIRAAFVRSLYTGHWDIVTGAVLQATAVLFSWRLSGAWQYAVICALVLVMGLIRAREAWSFAKLPPKLSSDRIIDYWEFRYRVLAVAAGLTLGAYAFTAIFLYPDDFSRIAAAIVCTGSMATVVGRLYGSKKLVDGMIISVLVPLSAALLMLGDGAHVAVGLFSIPFLLLVRGSAETLRQNMFEAVFRRREATKIARTLDVALNNMSHALIMFGDDRRIEVVNDKAIRFFGGTDADSFRHHDMRAVVRLSRKQGIFSDADTQRLGSCLNSAQGSSVSRRLQLQTIAGQHIEFNIRARDNGGGGVVVFEDVTERVISQNRIQYMARFDAMTGLRNRAEISSAMQSYLRGGKDRSLSAAFMIDVDDFKHINDTFGHPCGDQILKDIAERLKALESDKVFAARLGGDEFLIAASGFADLDAVKAFADQISTALCGSYTQSGSTFNIKISMGFVAPLHDQESFEDVLVRADLALYAAKANPSAHWMMFHEAMNRRYRDRQQLKADLCQAIKDEALHIIYQPILSADGLRLTSCEALARWTHPVKGAIGPAEFIPIAEETGLISEITAYMLRHATKQCQQWNEAMSVSVNLSALDFQHADIVAMVRNALNDSGLAPARLELEVTESVVLDDKSQAQRILWELSALGVKLALDDFGTGYSNLSYLHELPLNRIKIDRSFVSSVAENKRALQLLNGVTQLAKEMDLYITLEGIETFEQLELIGAAANVDRLQGFLFGASLTGPLVQSLGAAIWGREDEKWQALAATA
jgi:diguanylate cyclase (GGDEF)-like protein